MYLTRIQLTHYKNYSSETLDLSPRLNCFVGKNGMGKTNLLDAVYYLCMCKSSTSLNDRLVMQREAAFFRLEGVFEVNGKNRKVVAKVVPGKRKEIELNNNPYPKITEHIGAFPVVMIVPDDTELAKEGSEIRRRFMDNTLSQADPKYLEQLMLYNRILKQRNATLKRFAQEKTYDQALIQVFNNQMIEPANYIKDQRERFIQSFSPVFEGYYKNIANNQERVHCTYHSKLKEEAFEKLLEEASEKDRILQRSTVGIHKDDLKFYLNDFPLKKFASQGQLKSFVLAMKLAQYDFLKSIKGQKPLLLLDDIFDKLDRGRVEQLMKLLIEGDFGQVFITDTHEQRVASIIDHFEMDYKKFIIENGTAHSR